MDQPMRWLSNIGWRGGMPDEPSRMYDQTQEHARAMQTAWLKGKVIGRPKATEKHSVEQLEAMGLRGVYTTDPEPQR